MQPDEQQSAQAGSLSLGIAQALGMSKPETTESSAAAPFPR
jgi:hypothetical protein